MITQQELIDAIEPCVDESSISEVIQALRAICYAKAEHLESNWQDAETATLWSRAGGYLDSASQNKAVQAASIFGR